MTLQGAYAVTVFPNSLTRNCLFTKASTGPCGPQNSFGKFQIWPKCLILKIRTLSPKKLRDLAGATRPCRHSAGTRTIWSAKCVVPHSALFLFNSSQTNPRHLCQTFWTGDPRLAASSPSLHPSSVNNHDFNYNGDILSIPEKLQRSSLVINS